MSSFDLSILTQLQEKFLLLEQQIKEQEDELGSNEKEVESIKEQIQKLESQKLTLEMRQNEMKEKLLKLTELRGESTKQYETVKNTATQLLSFLQT